MPRVCRFVSKEKKAAARDALERKSYRAALRHAVRVEKDIQRLTRQVERELQRSNDVVQALAVSLGSRARAIEAERDTDRALATS